MCVCVCLSNLSLGKGLLYPVCGEGRRDPVFSADPLNPCPVKHPAALLAARAGWEHVLEAGDLLFVPADCPHFVANLDDTVAIRCGAPKEIKWVSILTPPFTSKYLYLGFLFLPAKLLGV